LIAQVIFSSGNGVSLESGKQQSSESKKIRHMVFLSVAYAANCGGTGTLTGTGSNLVLVTML
jgi:di/tricarboxylate transporter